MHSNLAFPALPLFVRSLCQTQFEDMYFAKIGHPFGPKLLASIWDESLPPSPNVEEAWGNHSMSLQGIISQLMPVLNGQTFWCYDLDFFAVFFFIFVLFSFFQGSFMNLIYFWFFFYSFILFSSFWLNLIINQFRCRLDDSPDPDPGRAWPQV